jgi:indole-3-glycerol phosphate synthase
MEIRRRPPAPAVVVDSQSYQVYLPDAKPKHILEAIIWRKEEEVEALRQQYPISRLKALITQLAPPRDFLGSLRAAPDPVALIAEVKKASPSKGILRQDFDPVAIAQAYERGGATCLSVLTDPTFFQGSGEYLTQVKASVGLPVLCKEFILYSYQILWARALQADAVLLIAALLSDADLGYLAKVVQRLGMTPLVEVHTLEELDRVLAWPDIELVGINNRDLRTFAVDLSTTERLLEARGSQLQERGITVVSESGIFEFEDLERLHRWGARAALVGEALVRAPDPALATSTLLGQTL